MQPTERSRRPIAVVGGGVTGLAAAYQLSLLGRRVRLFEADGRLGGMIRSELVDGWLVESGPNTLQESHNDVYALIDELKLKTQQVNASAKARNRYIVRDGRLCPLPLSPLELWRTPLFSAKTKRKVAAEILAKPHDRGNDVALAELVASHFGREFADYALDPVIAGIYAGDPARLSTLHTFPQLLEYEKEHGSLIRGQRAQTKARRRRGEPVTRVISFRHGLQVLVNALAHHIPKDSIELHATVENVRTAPGAPWRITWNRQGETHTDDFAAVVLALPAQALASLTFDANARRPLQVLEDVVHSPLASLFLGFRRDQVSHPLDGYGALAPAVENKELLGVIFSSSLFPGRAPHDHVAITAMAGGTLCPELVSLPPAKLQTRMLAQLRNLLGITGEPAFSRLHIWPRAIPQYNLGYNRFIEAIEICEQTYGGLYIGGQVRNGISLQNCLRAGLTLGEKAAR